MSLFQKLFSKKQAEISIPYLRLFSVKEEVVQFNSFSSRKTDIDTDIINYHKIFTQAQNQFFETFSKQVSLKNAEKKLNISLFAIANKLWTVEQKKQLYILMKQILWNNLEKDPAFKHDVFSALNQPNEKNVIFTKYGNEPEKRDFLYIYDLLHNVKVYRKNMRDLVKSQLCTFTEFNETHVTDLTVAKLLTLDHAQFDYYQNISKNQNEHHDFLEKILKDFNWFNFAFRLDESMLNMLKINQIDFNSLEKVFFIDNKQGLHRAPDSEKYKSSVLNFTEFNILKNNTVVNQWLYDNGYRNIPNVERFLSQYIVENQHISHYQKNLISYQHKILNDSSEIMTSKRNINRL